MPYAHFFDPRAHAQSNMVSKRYSVSFSQVSGEGVFQYLVAGFRNALNF